MITSFVPSAVDVARVLQREPETVVGEEAVERAQNRAVESGPHVRAARAGHADEQIRTPVVIDVARGLDRVAVALVRNRSGPAIDARARRARHHVDEARARTGTFVLPRTDCDVRVAVAVDVARSADAVAVEVVRVVAVERPEQRAGVSRKHLDLSGVRARVVVLVRADHDVVVAVVVDVAARHSR
jgi:hypothetical protein